MSKKRATDYNSWYKVGFALYAVSESLYDCFIEFSKKCKCKQKKIKMYGKLGGPKKLKQI